jgi:hypothetical protein
MNSGLSSIQVIRLKLEPGNPSVLYASTNLGGICKIGSLVTGTDVALPLLPQETALFQNYPNPFNPATTITFTLRARVYVSLKVFDILGREVATLESSELPAGNYARVWNPSDAASGIYFYRLTAGAFSGTRKLAVVR